MKIKMILSLGEGWPDLKADEVHEVGDGLGAQLVAKGWAVEMPPDPPKPKETPPPDKFEAARNQPGHVRRSGPSKP